MRRKIMLLILAVIFAFPLPTVNAQDDIKIFVNGEELYTDVAPIIIEGRTLVPIRAICEALGCQVDWDGSSETATISNKMDIINVKINSYWIKKSSRDGDKNREIEIDVPPMIIDGRTLVPVRAIAETLSALVQWDGSAQTVIVNYEYDYIDWFNDGLARAEKNGKWGFVNEQHIVIAPIIYDAANDFGDGVAAVLQDSKWGAIDTNGNLVIPLIYDYFLHFNDGLARAYISGNKLGYIDTGGNVVIPFIYEDARPFSEGLAGVNKDGKYGFVDTNGNEIIPFIYDLAGEFSEGFAQVEKDGERFHIDKNGNRAD